MHRGDIDDPPPAVLAHGGPDGLAEQEGRGQHQVDDLPPLGLGERLDGRDVLDAGVVDQDIHPTEALDRVGHRRLAGLAVGEIGLEEGRPGPLGDLLAGGIEVHRQYLVALFAEVTHHGLADAAAGTGDQGDAGSGSGRRCHGRLLVGWQSGMAERSDGWQPVQHKGPARRALPHRASSGAMTRSISCWARRLAASRPGRSERSSSSTRRQHQWSASTWKASRS